jgi:hypothetical protein
MAIVGLAVTGILGLTGLPVAAQSTPDDAPLSAAAKEAEATGKGPASAPQTSTTAPAKPAASAPKAVAAAASGAPRSAAASASASASAPAPARRAAATPAGGASAAGRVTEAKALPATGAGTGAASAPASGLAVLAAASRPAGTPVTPPANPCDVLARRMPNLTTGLCESALLQASGAVSVNGFPLYQRDVVARLNDTLLSDGARAPRRTRVLVVGGIHGDELSSTSLVFHWIAHALETGADMDWRFVPAVNPDGLMQPQPSRTNARGVDLNRNFPTPRWATEAPEYWAKRTRKDPRRYPGPAPLSEPETRFLQETMDRWKPDLIVSVHAPYGVLDYDGPSIPPERLGRLFLDRVGIFPGSLGHYGGVHRGVPVVTIELPSAIRTPTNAEMRQMWIDLLRWIGERVAVSERR